MSRQALIDALGQSQAQVLALVEAADDAAFRHQFHTDLSPIGWHLGHCVFVECFWLHEKVRGDNSITAPIADFYTPPRTPRPERGRRLPPREDLLAWARQIQAFNLDCLRNLRPEWREHALFDNDYLIHFLIQHYSQHYETMLMVLTQKSLAEDHPDAVYPTGLQAAPVRRDTVDVPAGHYRIGGDVPIAYDNEVPPQHAELEPFTISRQPVSNAEYLQFIQSNAYCDRSWWTEAGWSWLQRSGARHPEHWRCADGEQWYGVGLDGAYQLAPDEPAGGINYYEATAFARWAGGRLPHELQWEAACRSGLLKHTGQVWEWCENTFYPYAGFTPFPYDEYSQPWFDDRHYSLRGGSRYTRPAIKRPSFRNFYEADKRYVFAGVRLIY